MINPTKPRTRGDCRFAPKPCPFYTCKHHALYILTPTQIGQMTDEKILAMFDRLPPWASCTLDIIDHYSHHRPINPEGSGSEFALTLQEMADIYPTGQITRERVRQLIETRGNPWRKGPKGALRRLKYPGRSKWLRPFIEPDIIEYCRLA